MNVGQQHTYKVIFQSKVLQPNSMCRSLGKMCLTLLWKECYNVKCFTGPEKVSVFFFKFQIFIFKFDLDRFCEFSYFLNPLIWLCNGVQVLHLPGFISSLAFPQKSSDLLKFKTSASCTFQKMFFHHLAIKGLWIAFSHFKQRLIKILCFCFDVTRIFGFSFWQKQVLHHFLDWHMNDSRL